MSETQINVYPITVAHKLCKTATVCKLKKPLACVRCGAKATMVKRTVTKDGIILVHLLVDDNDLNNYLTIDHIVPLSIGGSNYTKNKQIMCKKCNNDKKSKMTHGEVIYMLQNIRYVLKANKKLKLYFIRYLVNNHVNICTVSVFKNILREIPYIVFYTDKLLDVLSDQMQLAIDNTL